MCPGFPSSATSTSAKAFCASFTTCPDFFPPIDVEGEPGLIRASRAGTAVAREYAVTVARLVCYHFDSQQALDERARARRVCPSTAACDADVEEQILLGSSYQAVGDAVWWAQP